MRAGFSTLRYRVLALSGALILAAFLLGLIYALALGRFQGHVNTFKNDNLPRFEASHRLEDWSYSILSGVSAFGSAASEDELRTAYTQILDDIVSLEAAASDQFNLTGDVSSLEMNRLIGSPKMSRKTI